VIVGVAFSLPLVIWREIGGLLMQLDAKFPAPLPEMGSLPF
jgi:hypothetical protein